jgi:hypothetical protein
MANLSVEAEDMVLDQKCWSCNPEGRGTVVKFEPCEYCDNSGYRTTKLGEHILEFVRRHPERK